MGRSAGNGDREGGLADLLRRTARWAWERDEIDQRVGPQKIAFDGVLYGSMFLVCSAIGVLLWLVGEAGWATTIWLVGNGLAAFFGVVAVGWDVLEYRKARRGPDETVAEGPGRELAPDLSLSDDAKIAFVVTVVLLSLLSVAVLLLESVA